MEELEKVEEILGSDDYRNRSVIEDMRRHWVSLSPETQAGLAKLAAIELQKATKEGRSRDAARWARIVQKSIDQGHKLMEYEISLMKEKEGPTQSQSVIMLLPDNGRDPQRTSSGRSEQPPDH